MDDEEGAIIYGLDYQVKLIYFLNIKNDMMTHL
jgi:hypothetical protein